MAILVAATLVQLATGFLNVLNWYPFPWYFPPVHRFLGYVVVGSVLLHIAVKLPDIVYGLQTKVADGDVLTEIPWNENPALAQQRRPAPAAGHPGAVPARRTHRSRGRHRRRRGHLGRPDADPAGTARAAGGPAAQHADRRACRSTAPPTRRRWPPPRPRRTGPCRSTGRRPYALSLAEVEALAAYEARLPITCVEGWSVQRALARCSGCSTSSSAPAATADSRVQFHSVESRRATTTRRCSGRSCRRRVLATHLNGERLNLDHGYPLRLIAPNRPGVLNTKWLARIEVR